MWLWWASMVSANLLRNVSVSPHWQQMSGKCLHWDWDFCSKYANLSSDNDVTALFLFCFGVFFLNLRGKKTKQVLTTDVLRCQCIVYASSQSVGSQLRSKAGDKQVMAQFTWKLPLHRQGLAQKHHPLPEKLRVLRCALHCVLVTEGSYGVCSWVMEAPL